MGKVKNENYYQVQGWMVNELGLKGNELMIYAIIYGFSQTDGQYFTGSQSYLAEWTNATDRSVRNTLSSLIEKGLLEKIDKTINRVKYCEYKALIPDREENISVGGTEKISAGTENISVGGTEKISVGTEKISANNYKNNNNLKNIEDRKKERKTSTYETVLDSYQLDPKLREALIEFIKMRKLIKSPMSDYALNLLIKKLAKMSSDINEQIAILEQSIQNSWKGVFPLKTNNQSNGTYGNKVADDLNDFYERASRWAEKG